MQISSVMRKQRQQYWRELAYFGESWPQFRLQIEECSYVSGHEIASLRHISYDCKQRHGSLDGLIYFDFATSLVPILCFLWLRLAFSFLFS